MTDPLNERVAVLETIVSKLEIDIKDRMARMEKKVDDIYEVFVGGKHVKLFTVAIIGFVTFVATVAYYISSIFHGFR